MSHTHTHVTVYHRKTAAKEVFDAGNSGMFSAHIKQERSGVID